VITHPPKIGWKIRYRQVMVYATNSNQHGSHSHGKLTSAQRLRER